MADDTPQPTSSSRHYDGLTEGPGPQGRLAETLGEIAIMLSYVGQNGISVPDDLRAKIDQLINHPEVAKLGLFAKIRWSP